MVSSVTKTSSAANSNIKSIDDFMMPFQIDGANISGRLIRTQKTITRILKSHDYPLPVSKFLGEALLLISLLGSGMKLQHRIILQIKGDGALPLVVADYYADGSVRGYIECNQALYDQWTGGEEVNPFLLIGKGHLAITVDHGGQTKPYQGIVPLQGESLSAAILGYIEGSEQIKSSLKLIINEKEIDGTRQWYAAAMLIQKLGRSGETLKDERHSTEDEEKWINTKALFHTLTDEELLDDELAPDRLLYRLFHEDGVRVFEKKDLKFECQCNMDRLEAVLKNSSEEDLKALANEDGFIEANCQFCQNKYQFSLKDL